MINVLLFLYGAALGLPDVAVPVGPTKLRIDDLLVVIVFVASLMRGLRYTPFEKKIVSIYLIYYVYCLLSFVILHVEGLITPDSYNIVRATGCIVIILALLKQNDVRSMKSLAMGFAVGGFLIIAQVLPKYQYYVGMPSLLRTYYELKSSLSFETYNPNAVGVMAYVFTFTLIIASKYFKNKMPFFLLAGLMSILPLIAYTRAAFGAICVAFVVFNILQGRLSFRNAVLLVFIGGTFYALFQYQPAFIEKAFSIDIGTGSGLSGRGILWETGWDIFTAAPLMGHGVGSEYFQFMQLNAAGISHNSYLSSLVEGGLLGLALMLLPYLLIFVLLWHARRYTGDFTINLSIAFVAGTLVMGLGYSDLYWSKFITILLSFIVVNVEHETGSVQFLDSWRRDV